MDAFQKKHSESIIKIPGLAQTFNLAQEDAVVANGINQYRNVNCKPT